MKQEASHSSGLSSLTRSSSLNIESLELSEIRLQQLHLYVDNHQHDRLLAPMLSLITGSVLSVWVSWQVAALWMLISFLITRNYLRVYSNFKKSAPQAKDAYQWERRIAMAHGLHMLHWAGLSMWAWQPGNFANHIFIAMIVMGLMSATTAMSSPSKRLFLLDMLPIIIIACTRPLFEQGLLYNSMAALSVCFSILMIHVGLQIHQNLLKMLCLQQERKQLMMELENMATTDALTGTSNRRAFMTFAREEVIRSQRYQHPLSLLMIDIDHFKRVNDNFGHAMGDQVIRVVAEIISEECRHSDRVARLGGEEFALLLPECGICLAEVTAERIRQRIAQTLVSHGDQASNITISIGVAELTAAQRDIDSLLDLADKRLYRAKQAGRNRVETA
ncbi:MULTISPECIES: GGDEF domain-containing protein [Corallincola]|uniref:diguanylate cyclase n=3 Tax=Corallincola TaxID=1775176 RepID=A0A368N6K9_9GAMM|nr:MULTISPECIES: GGDEF domain-containing protein [Corallincola]RCU45643.1 GGDEF domain-containing protein [Corallincola holothuriorum]TAA41767.1 GGDEF domain-containing protein [Corallincola spongiicola]TCI02242.1 GGDEF domain-containing protein [Corallincola luteus]